MIWGEEGYTDLVRIAREGVVYWKASSSSVLIDFKETTMGQNRLGGSIH